MRAISADMKQKRVILGDHPDPVRDDPADVELRILEVGVCGTDREIARFEYGTPPPGLDQLILGHECLAEVVQAGPEAEGFSAGDLVVPMVRRPCPHPECPACRAGRQDFCYTGDFTERGIKGRHGYMSERAVVNARWLVKVPPSLRRVAVLVEPLTIAQKALVQVRDLQERLPWTHRDLPAGALLPGHGVPERRGGRQRALVLGAGPVGLLGAMALAAAHYEVFVYSREPKGGPKARIAEGVGAHYLSAQDTPLEKLPGAAGSLDLVYEATGASAFAFRALSVLGTNGVFVFTGVPGRKGKVELDTHRVMRDLVLKNQVVLGTVNAGRDAFDRAVRDLAVFHAQWPKALAGLITGRHPPEAFERLLAGSGGIKDVIEFGA